MDLLSAILSDFNDMFGNINWNDADNVRRQILEIPGMVSRDEQYQNAMRNSDKQEARTESDRVLQKIIFSIMADNMELFKQFTDNPEFKKWLSDLVFNLTYNKEGKPYQSQHCYPHRYGAKHPEGRDRGFLRRVGEKVPVSRRVPAGLPAQSVKKFRRSH